MAHNLKSTGKSGHQLLDDTYQILATLSRGQNSVVYKAKNIKNYEDESLVALKVAFKEIHSKDAFQRLKREALSLLATRHNNVVRMIDYKVAGDLCYLVLDYAENGSLQQLLQRSPNGLPWQQAINIMKQILAGLASVHRAGIVHCDIKPENLFMTDHGIVKIGDFSVACFPHEEEQLRGGAKGVGTLEYLAPETLKDSIYNAKTDIYSAGITFFKLITGNYPFPNDSLASHARAKLAGRRYSLSHFVEIPSAGFESIISQALAEHPQARFQSAEQFLIELEKFEKMLFGKGDYTPATRKVVNPLVASEENRFLEQHEHFSSFRDEIESGDAALVSVEAAEAGPFGSLTMTCYRLFDRYLSTTVRRVGFMAALVFVFWATYKIVSLNSVNVTEQKEIVGSLWLSKPDRVLQAFQPYLEDEIHIGMMRGLIDPEREDPIFFRRLEDGSYSFGIGVEGFIPTNYSYQGLADAREIKVSGEIGDVVFVIQGKTNFPPKVWGDYRVEGTEHKGSWILW